MPLLCLAARSIPIVAIAGIGLLGASEREEKAFVAAAMVLGFGRLGRVREGRKSTRAVRRTRVWRWSILVVCWLCLSGRSDGRGVGRGEVMNRVVFDAKDL